jgi:Tfp pilus assembly protein PilN
MSVRVNLLPEATRHRARASRQQSLLAGSGLVLLAILGAVYWWASSQVSEAETLLAAESAATTELRGEVNDLSGFRDLAQRRDAAGTVLAETMAGEISFAGVLQDLASVMPGDAQLETLALTSERAGANGSDPAPTVGIFTATGKTLTAHAPGVERLLLELDKVVGLVDPYLNSSTLDDPDDRVATFSLEGLLGAEVTTGRYHDGLPEELR